jgi:hypothetical protein
MKMKILAQIFRWCPRLSRRHRAGSTLAPPLPHTPVALYGRIACRCAELKCLSLSGVGRNPSVGARSENHPTWALANKDASPSVKAALRSQLEATNEKLASTEAALHAALQAHAELELERESWVRALAVRLAGRGRGRHYASLHSCTLCSEPIVP